MKFLAIVLMVVLASCLSQACEDKSPEQCRGVLQPHFCYLEHNRRLCCRTCQHYRTNDPHCEYGDHYANIVRRMHGKESQHTCESYVAMFGRHHCIAELKFRNTCCKSCSEQ